jgi:hypothetical protein
MAANAFRRGRNRSSIAPPVAIGLNRARSSAFALQYLRAGVASAMAMRCSFFVRHSSFATAEPAARAKASVRVIVPVELMPLF